MRNDQRWIAASIVLAGAMIAIALYAALRPRVAPSSPVSSARPQAEPAQRFVPISGASEEEPAQPERPPPSPPTALPGAMEPAEAFPTPAAPPEHRSTEAIGATREAFDRVRDDVVAECWRPPAGGPSEVPLHLNVSFGPDGGVLASGVSEDRSARVDGLARCVHRFLHDLEIPPPGTVVPVELSITIP